MIISIDRNAVLNAIRSHEREYKIAHVRWSVFGIKFIPHGDNKRLHFNVKNKQLLMWAMLKYGFEIETNSNL